MQKQFLLLLFLLSTSLTAKVLISPVDAMKEQYGEDVQISKKNIMLTKKKYSTIEHEAKVKLNTKIYRVFSAKKDNEVLGYGILINRKVRSKNAVILYFISKGKLLDIEIIAFNEPAEYIPSKTWKSQFHNIQTTTMLKLSREIPTITGATLSARSVTDASRIAFAIYNKLFKEK